MVTDNGIPPVAVGDVSPHANEVRHIADTLSDALTVIDTQVPGPVPIGVKVALASVLMCRDQLLLLADEAQP